MINWEFVETARRDHGRSKGVREKRSREVFERKAGF